MKDYSQFIPNSFGFITKYEIVEDEIHVYTPETKKGQPHKYPATKEKIAFFEDRLKKQYELVVENREFLKEQVAQESKKTILPVTSIAAAVMALVAAGIVALSSLPVWVAAILGTAALATGIAGPVMVSHTTKQFEQETELARIYLDKRADIDAVSKDDSNVTAYLSKSATKKLSATEELRKKKRIDTRFSIDFLDKASLKDLKQLIARYLISTNINKEQQFVRPAANTPQQNKPKKRVLKKEEQ